MHSPSPPPRGPRTVRRSRRFAKSWHWAGAWCLPAASDRGVAAEHYIGVMSGTSVDGVDAVLADFGAKPLRSLAVAHIAFPDSLRLELQALQRSGADEIHRAALSAN